MVEGILVVNLDPPYVSFVEQQDKTGTDQRKRKPAAVRHCTIQELRLMLLELGAIVPYQQWPPREYTIHMPGTYSQATLDKLGFEQPKALAKSN